MEEWISFNEFMRRYKMGYEAVLKMIHEGKVDAQKVGSRYKIRVGGDTVSRELYEKTLERALKAELLLENLKAILSRKE